MKELKIQQEVFPSYEDLADNKFDILNKLCNYYEIEDKNNEPPPRVEVKN